MVNVCIVITTESNSPIIHQSIETMDFVSNQTPLSRELSSFYTENSNDDGIRGSDVDIIHPPPSHHHPCDSFSFPPPPPPGLRRPGPRRKPFFVSLCYASTGICIYPFALVIMFSVSCMLSISRRGLSSYAKASI